MVREPVDADRPRRRGRPLPRALVKRPDEGSTARRIAWAVVGALVFVAAKLFVGF